MAVPVYLSKHLLQVFFFLSIFLTCIAFQSKSENVHLQILDEFPTGKSDTFLVEAPKSGRQKLLVFCYPGQHKKWFRLWTNPKLALHTDGKVTNYKVYYGNNETEVVENSESSVYLTWRLLPFVWNRFAFYPFNKSCIGFASEQTYQITFTITNPELVYIVLTVIGLLLFFYAEAWSRNVALHYSAGISLGVLGSLLILSFFISKFLPQKLRYLTWVIAAVSGSMSFYLFQYVGSYLQLILLNNWKIMAVYFLVFGLASFAVVYRYGPVTNTRSLNLIKWVLQAVGLALMYQNSQIPEMSVALILLALAAFHIPPRALPLLQNLRFRYFPPKRRLLSEEEYQIEGDIETKEALEELRQFCCSPQCNSWKTVSKLKSPNRFASFIEGDSHISDTEFECHVNDSDTNGALDSRDSTFSEEGSDSEMSLTAWGNGLVKRS